MCLLLTPQHCNLAKMSQLALMLCKRPLFLVCPAYTQFVLMHFLPGKSWQLGHRCLVYPFVSSDMLVFLLVHPCAMVSFLGNPCLFLFVAFALHLFSCQCSETELLLYLSSPSLQPSVLQPLLSVRCRHPLLPDPQNCCCRICQMNGTVWATPLQNHQMGSHHCRGEPAIVCLVPVWVPIPGSEPEREHWWCP